MLRQEKKREQKASSNHRRCAMVATPRRHHRHTGLPHGKLLKLISQRKSGWSINFLDNLLLGCKIMRNQDRGSVLFAVTFWKNWLLRSLPVSPVHLNRALIRAGLRSYDYRRNSTSSAPLLYQPAQLVESSLTAPPGCRNPSSKNAHSRGFLWAYIVGLMFTVELSTLSITSAKHALPPLNKIRMGDNNLGLYNREPSEIRDSFIKALWWQHLGCKPSVLEPFLRSGPLIWVSFPSWESRGTKF